MTQSNVEHALAPEVLDVVRDTALFYPCSGDDLEGPIRLFASAVSDFYFVDLRTPRKPNLHGIAVPTRPLPRGARIERFVHLASGHEFNLHRRRERAEYFLDQLPPLGVFFFRGDNPVEGEGSSGVLWFGGDLFTRILEMLVPGGLIVTDGSNPGPNGPEPLSTFYHHRSIGRAAVEAVEPFEYGGRSFTCIDYVGEKNGPTLVWRAA
jgi:hypothetical protein